MSKDNLFWNENSNEVPLEALKREDAPKIDTVPESLTEPSVDNASDNAVSDIVEEQKDQTDAERDAALDAASSNLASEAAETPLPAAAEPDEVVDATVSEVVPAEQVASDDIVYAAPLEVECPNGQYAGQPICVADQYVEAPMVEVYDKRAAKKRFTAIGFGFALFSFITFGAVLVMELIAMLIESLYGVSIIDSNLFLNAVTPAAMYLFALPIVIGFLALLRVKGERPPEKRKMPFSMWVVVIVICFGLMYIGAFIGQFVMTEISSLVGYDFSNALDEVVDYNSLWISAIFVCIVAPIGEELVFRKLIIDRTHKYGAVVSVFLSALMFGLMHGNFYQFFYAFMIGLVLGYVYYSTGKIWYTILLHMIVNFFGSIVTTILAGASDSMLKALEGIDYDNFNQVLDFVIHHGWAFVAETAFTLFIFAAMICAVVVPLVMRKKMFPKREGTPISKKKSFAAAFSSPGVIVMLVVYVIEFALPILLPLIMYYLGSTPGTTV